MVEVGSMEVKGTLDTSDIDRGATRINNQMSDIKSNVESSTGSFLSLGQATSAVAGSLVKIGTAGITAMTGLAALSPQVAPAMAMIANETRKLSFALGERLSPLFESVGNDLIPGIGTAIETLTPQIESLVGSGVQGITDISSVLSGEWSSISNLIPKGAGVIAGIKMGAPFGLPGMLMGAALGYIAGDELGDAITATSSGATFDTETVGPAGISLDTQEGISSSFLKDPTGTAATVSKDTILGSLMGLLEGIFSSLGDKQIKYSGPMKV